MKNLQIVLNQIPIVFFIFFGAFLLHSQTFEIKYTMTMDIDALNDSVNANERAKSFLSEDTKNELFSQMAKPQDFILVYNEGKSLYKIAPENDQDKEENNLEVGHKFNFRRFMRKNSPVLYKDFESNQMIQQENILDKQFLIIDSLKTLDWQITDKTKTFGEFTCTQATATNIKNQNVSVCYSEDVPISEGPGEYFGLPGLVVEVVVGPVHINLTELKIIGVATVIEPPSEGKEISRENFKKLMEERAANFGGPGMSIFH